MMVLPKDTELASPPPPSPPPAFSVNNNQGEDSTINVKKVVEGRDGALIVDPENNPTVLKAIHQIRQKLVQEYAKNPHLYIERDVEMISKCDYFVRRFLYPHDLDAEGAYEQTRTWLAWRKEEGFESATDQRFPREFYQIGACFRYLPDKQGTLLMYCRFKVYKRLDILDRPIKQFLVYNMDKMDSTARRERGWAIVFDTRGAGLAQVDFDMLIFLFKTIKQYYPWGLKYVAVYELPWILQSGWKIAQKLLPEDATRLIQFHNKQSIQEIIPLDHLPDFMGGTCDVDYKTVPDGCRSSEEIGAEEFGFTPEQVKATMRHFEKFFSDSQQENTINGSVK